MRRPSVSTAKPKLLSDQALARLRELPIADVASAVGITLRGNKAMCFNGHDTATPSFTVSKAWICPGFTDRLGLGFQAGTGSGIA